MRRFALSFFLLIPLVVFAGTPNPPDRPTAAGAFFETVDRDAPSAPTRQAPDTTNISIAPLAVEAIAVDYVGDADARHAVESGLARPTALAAADIDGDGVEDLICGYATDGGGILALHRGNVDAIFPHTPAARARRAVDPNAGAPFHSPARLFMIPESPDFLGAGDFDNDGHRDVVAATRGSSTLYLLWGDGSAALSRTETVYLPGVTTAMVIGQWNRPDALVDLGLGVDGPAGPALLVFAGRRGALRSEPLSIPLPEPAVQLVLGRMDDDHRVDLAVAAGPELLLVRARPRGKPSIPERIVGLNVPISSVAFSDFAWDRSAERELAALTEDGILHVLARAQHADDESHTRAWTVIGTRSVVTPHDAGHARLLPVRLSGLPSQELLIVGGSPQRARLVAGMVRADDASGSVGTLQHEGQVVAIVGETQPVAILPMRLNADALTDLVLLDPEAPSPAAAMIGSRAVITVNSALDSLVPGAGDGACTLREALNNANADSDSSGGDCAVGSGADTIGFAIGGGGSLATIQPIVPLPSVSDSVTINGNSQGCASPPCIELDGTHAASANAVRLTAGSSTVRGLVMNRFGGHAVRVESDGNYLEGNFIGTDASGTDALGNGLRGISLYFVSNTTIGGTTAGARNVISGNQTSGVLVYNGSNNSVLGNYIGTDVTGTIGMANGSAGVELDRSSNNTVGGTTPGARNIISSNLYGVVIDTTTDNQVQGNYLGTDVTGTSALGNDEGIFVYNAPNNVIGGTASGAGNLISGNLRYGVTIYGLPATGNRVEGNLIGTDAAGTSALGNVYDAVFVWAAPGNVIGGTTAEARNVLSGNRRGVLVYEGASGNEIIGNYIGTDVTGTADLGNSRSGVYLYGAPNNTVGGTDPGAGNLISGNSYGVVISLPAATGNQVQGNLIGTNVTGSVSLGNVLDGVFIQDAPDNTVGGDVAAARNVISGSGDNGVRITGANATGNRVQGNHIGTDAGGTVALGNLAQGVILDAASDNTIGGTGVGVGNLIMGNGGPGVFIKDFAAAGNAVLGNSIHANGGLGIALENESVWINDPGDPDDGCNQLQNYPVLTSIAVGATDTNVQGTLNSLPNQTYRLEFFTNTGCDVSAHGPAESLLGHLDVTTDADGNATFSQTFPNTIPTSNLITATATAPDSSTSELSICGTDTESDGDTVSDLDDCDPGDNLVWTLPGATVELDLSHTGGLGGTTTLSWKGPTPVGGAVLVYDTIGSADPRDFVTSASCVESNDGSDTVALHTTDPPLNTVLQFLIRAENLCGGGSVGERSNGTARSARSCL